MKRIYQGGQAVLCGWPRMSDDEVVDVLAFLSVPAVVDGELRYVAGATIRWLASTTFSYTQGATYNVEYDQLRPKL